MVQPEFHQTFQTDHLGDTSDRGSVQGKYLNNQEVFWHKSNFKWRLTHKGIMEEEVMNFIKRRFPIPSIFEYHNFEEDSSLMKKRPEPNPIIGFNMDSLSKKPNIRRNGQRIMKSNLQPQPNQFYTCLDWKLAGSICFKPNIGDQKINLGIQEAHPVIQKSQTSPFHAPVTIGQEDPL